MARLGLKVCHTCLKQRTLSRFDHDSVNCFDCQNRCRKCKSAKSICICSTKQARYKEEISKNAIYCDRFNKSLTGQFTNALYQMHVHGRSKYVIRSCFSESDAGSIYRFSMQRNENIDQSVCNVQRRMLFQYNMTTTTFSWPSDSLSSIYCSIKRGHPAITEMSVILFNSVCEGSSSSFFADFPEYSDASNNRFLNSPISVLISLDSNAKVLFRDKYKTGKDKSIEQACLGQGDGVVYRGNLLHAITLCDEPSVNFLLLAFGTNEYRYSSISRNLTVLEVRDAESTDDSSVDGV